MARRVARLNGTSPRAMILRNCTFFFTHAYKLQREKIIASERVMGHFEKCALNLFFAAIARHFFLPCGSAGSIGENVVMHVSLYLSLFLSHSNDQRRFAERLFTLADIEPGST